jgi:hypothetical protein
MVPGQLIVSVKDGVTEQEFRDAVGALDAKLKVEKFHPVVGVASVSCEVGKEADSIHLLTSLRCVDSAEQSVEARAS